jgi:hypothetical protein
VNKMHSVTTKFVVTKGGNSHLFGLAWRKSGWFKRG